MSMWTNAVLTAKGEALLAKLVAGNNLTITRAVTGTGYVNPASLKVQTDVTDPVQTLELRPVRYPEPGECALPVFLTNDNITAGYTVMQVGVFAQDPDEGEILYFIAQALPDSGTEIPANTTVRGFSAEWAFYFQYGQADGVTVTVDPSNSVGYTEFDETIREIYAALALKANQSELDTANTKINAKLSRAGGTMTGQIQFQTAHYISTPIKVVDANANGQLMVGGAGGDVVIGSGESPDNIVAAIGVTGTGDRLFLTSDDIIRIFVNCDTIANRKELTIDANGHITVPTGPTANMHLATKQYVDAAAATKQKTITSGTSAPSGGSAGDIYIQY